MFLFKVPETEKSKQHICFKILNPIKTKREREREREREEN
jgi:hypothetical protein